MKPIRSSDKDSVLEQLEKTYPNYTLCSPENLARIDGKLEITNPARFWNARSKEILTAIHDINVIFHRYPESYQLKIIASNQFETLFSSQIFSTLESRIRDVKNASPEDTAKMIQICSTFMQLGLSGMLRSMPSDFTHILEPKVQEIFTLMRAINQYTRRIAPKYAKSTDFPFDLYADIT